MLTHPKLIHQPTIPNGLVLHHVIYPQETIEIKISPLFSAQTTPTTVGNMRRRSEMSDALQANSSSLGLDYALFPLQLSQEDRTSNFAATKMQNARTQSHTDSYSVHYITSNRSFDFDIGPGQLWMTYYHLSRIGTGKTDSPSIAFVTKTTNENMGNIIDAQYLANALDWGVLNSEALTQSSTTESFDRDAPSKHEDHIEGEFAFQESTDHDQLHPLHSQLLQLSLRGGWVLNASNLDHTAVLRSSITCLLSAILVLDQDSMVDQNLQSYSTCLIPPPWTREDLLSVYNDPVTDLVGGGGPVMLARVNRDLDVTCALITWKRRNFRPYRLNSGSLASVIRNAVQLIIVWNQEDVGGPDMSRTRSFTQLSGVRIEYPKNQSEDKNSHSEFIPLPIGQTKGDISSQLPITADLTVSVSDQKQTNEYVLVPESTPKVRPRRVSLFSSRKSISCLDDWNKLSASKKRQACRNVLDTFERPCIWPALVGHEELSVVAIADYLLEFERQEQHRDTSQEAKTTNASVVRVHTRGPEYHRTNYLRTLEDIFNSDIDNDSCPMLWWENVPRFGNSVSSTLELPLPSPGHSSDLCRCLWVISRQMPNLQYNPMIVSCASLLLNVLNPWAVPCILGSMLSASKSGEHPWFPVSAKDYIVKCEVNFMYYISLPPFFVCFFQVTIIILFV